MAGLTPQGFQTKTTAELIEELAQAFQARLGNVNTQADSVLGGLMAVVAARLGELWELGQALFAAFDPDQSTGAALEGLSALTGTERLGPTPSTARVFVDLDPGITLSSGSRIHVQDAPARVFETLQDVGPQTYRRWFPVLVSAVQDGPTVAPKGALTHIVTPIAGWNAVTNGDLPATAWSGNSEPFTLADGQSLFFVISTVSTVLVFHTTDFADITQATAQEVADRINSSRVASRLTAVAQNGRVTIETLLQGADASLLLGGAVATALDFPTDTLTGYTGASATLGRALENDLALSTRRGDELEKQGTSTGESLRAQLVDPDNRANIIDAAVYQNRNDVVDPNGIPPHAFRVVVFGPQADTDAIANILFRNSPLGIQSQGRQSATLLDSQNNPVTVRWDFATQKPLYVDATISVIERDYVGDDAIKEALAQYIDTLLMNDDVIAEAAKARLFQPGVYDVPAFIIDDRAPPRSGDNIPIAFDELATLDVNNIVLNVNFIIPT